ncbi:MAG: DEAD/DEAH box helicase family protein, partial [Actinobacteria bacterium]|nr:DEAD/DEAH box helicase family protein [Actinomycetota bacterium]
MKLQFKIQPYQTEAVGAVVDCFAGQPFADGVSYRIDPGKASQQRLGEDSGFRNADLRLSGSQLLANIQEVQRHQNLARSTTLVTSKAGKINLDVEMETGTGKTYVYIKTIMELHKRYGWSKYIVVVPSVAIREGVKKSVDITAEHFQESYGTKPRSFIYNSSQLHELESFSSDAGVQVMIINIQAFNATGKDNRRIYDVLDDFQSRKPIDVIAANRPIVIIDEPQKIGSPKSQDSLSNFGPLFLLRYSATHKVEHNKVHRLDALDAYNQKLVKKIAVRGITVKGLAGSTAYLFLDAIEVKKGAKPVARIELEVQTKGSIKRLVKRVEVGTNLHDLAGGIEAYKPDGKALIVTDIDANRDIIELSNGEVVSAGQITEDVTQDAKRRIQIREAIRSHLDKERELFGQGIKVLSLFFIDEVAKYRDYSREDTLGEYARWFEEEYEVQVTDYLAELPFEADDYRLHLQEISARETHQGYFSIDKKSNRLVDGDVHKTGDEKGQSKDVAAYDLILKQKERLLSFDEPVRFLFSHSALREGWDNPNVFTMGMLKK